MMKLWHVFSMGSLRIKLTFSLSLLFFIVCCSAALLIEHNYDSNISKLENRLIEYRLEKLHAIIDDRADFVDVIRQDLEWGSLYTRSPVLYTRILNSAGQVVLESDGMGNVAPPRVFPLVPANGSSDGTAVIQTQNSRNFLLKTDSQWSDEPGKSVAIQIALDITSAMQIDAANHKNIILALLVGMLVTLVIGSMIIRKMLQPLEEIGRYSSHITYMSIRDRIDSSHWPKEFRLFTATFNAMLDRLGESYTRLSECTTNMAHELRTPLTAIIGEAEVALLRDRTPDEYRQVLESGIEESLRLSRIIDNVLFLARASNPEQRIVRTLFDPVAEIRDLCEFYEAMVEEQGGRVSCHGEGELAGDPDLFRRAISNLLVNAITYSQTGVAIDLFVRKPGTHFTDVVIRDTGSGIAEEDLEFIFDRFHRNDRAHSNYSHGAGLGLAIVKVIMDLHGGTVAVSSKPGQGTTFTLRFPQHTLFQEGSAYASANN